MLFCTDPFRQRRLCDGMGVSKSKRGGCAARNIRCLPPFPSGRREKKKRREKDTLPPPFNLFENVRGVPPTLAPALFTPPLMSPQNNHLILWSLTRMSEEFHRQVLSTPVGAIPERMQVQQRWPFLPGSTSSTSLDLQLLQAVQPSCSQRGRGVPEQAAATQDMATPAQIQQ